MGRKGVAEGSGDIKTLQIDLWNLYKDVPGSRPRTDVVDWTREQWNDPEFLKGEIAKLSQQDVADPMQEDAYMGSLGAMLERQLEPNMELDTWVDNFQNADPQKYHQFKNKTPEKKK
jgi:hypothetical protein